jgi:hypothetical protein
MDPSLELLHDNAVAGDLLRRICRTGLCANGLGDNWDRKRIDKVGERASLEKLRRRARGLHDVSALCRGGRGEQAHLFEEVPAGDLHELA